MIGGTDAAPFDGGPGCTDGDGDGYSAVTGCGLLDCDDANAAVSPVGTETCNNVDDDCDGTIDDGLGTTSCGVGACARTIDICSAGTTQTCSPGTGASETCNNVDDDCNGTVDDGLAAITCGVGACSRSVTACVGGVAQTCTPGTAAAETCGNGIDDNCDGAIDDGCCTSPTNSTCSTATAYSIGATASGTNACSGADIAATCGNAGAGNEQVYSVSLDGSATAYTFTMTGASGYNTVLHVASAVSCTTSSSVACNDDYSGTNVSQVTLNGPAAGTYYIIADSNSASAAAGTFTLTSSSTTLNNDLCSGAIAITRSGTYIGSNTGKANNYTPSCGGSGLDVVYSITPTTSTTISLDTCGTAYDTVLAVQTGTCGTGTSVACNDDYSTSVTGCTPSSYLYSSLSFSATAGTTYYVIVDGYSSSSTGNYVLNVSGL